MLMNVQRQVIWRWAVAIAVVTAGFIHGSAETEAVTIDWVTVGNAGNANDPATGNLYGAVSYDYQIMKFEFTNSQYAAFLNAVDPEGSNPQGIWNSNMGSNARGGISFTNGNSAGTKYAAKTNMGDKPVNYVSWFDVARVANWLHNGAQTFGSTAAAADARNTGAYTVGTATIGNAVSRNEGALFYIPTENEWYKAAFYNPTLNGGAGGYRVYGNGFDTAPALISANAVGVGSAGGTGNFANYSNGANWNSLNGNLTTVGTNGGSSYYGAFDMSGNVTEWNDLTGVAGSSRYLRGGSYNIFPSGLSSSSRFSLDPSVEFDDFGFRLASPVAVPEPSTWAMAGIGIACAGWGAYRRRRAR
jgi:sulfatase modifying factor 1